MNKEYNWVDLWKTITIQCPFCSAEQTVKYVINTCFYCGKEFGVGVDGKPVEITEYKFS